jgi:hypothetical protein
MIDRHSLLNQVPQCPLYDIGLQAVMLQLQFFPLSALRAKQNHVRLAAFAVKFADDFQPHRAAFEAGYIEAMERAVGVRLRRLVIFASHKITCCIHGAILSDEEDKGCPTQTKFTHIKSQRVYDFGKN